MTLATIEMSSVRLKRKVRNTETKLFEWQPCRCRIVRQEGKLKLQFESPPCDEESQDDDREMMNIDLVTQFVNIKIKKHKTRCDLEFYAPNSREVEKMELMAPSVAHCQQWVTQVQRIQQEENQQQVRTSEVAPVAPLSSSQVANSRFIDDTTVTREVSPLKRELSSSGSKFQQSPPRSPTSSLSSSAISFTLPDNYTADSTSISCRARCESILENELDHTVDSSNCSPVLDNVPNLTARASNISSISSSSALSSTKHQLSSPQALPLDTSRHSQLSFIHNEANSMDSESEIECVQYQRRRRRTVDIRQERLAKLDLSSTFSHNLPSSRVSNQIQSYNDFPRNSKAFEQSKSSQAELQILQRVETALRALELENAQAKTRERELLQELQTLRDTARVAAAEQKHTEQEYRRARRELDLWRRAAQNAEAAAAQLEEQLDISRQENQLIANEKLRLKHQNTELLTQVHRLDSLVYGRF